MFVFRENSQVQLAGENITRRILAHSENVMPCELHMEKGAVVKEHVHPHEQCSYIISGSCYFTIGQERRMVRSGDSVYIPSNVPHKVEVAEDSVVIDIFAPMREDFLQ